MKAGGSFLGVARISRLSPSGRRRAGGDGGCGGCQAVRVGLGSLAGSCCGCDTPGPGSGRGPSDVELMAGASALLPRSRELDADAPGADRTAVAGGPVSPAAAMLPHRADVQHVLCAGVRDARPDGAADGVRDARRVGAVPGVVAPPGAPVLLAGQLV